VGVDPELEMLALSEGQPASSAQPRSCSAQ